MDSSKVITDRERIAKQIAKTSESIRKRYRALKTGKMEEDVALERHFKPIIEPLKQIVENTPLVKNLIPLCQRLRTKCYPREKKKSRAKSEEVWGKIQAKTIKCFV